ncbi:MAG: DUF4388 domain-containing protein, partial [Chloroflexota bacterium]
MSVAETVFDGHAAGRQEAEAERFVTQRSLRPQGPAGEDEGDRVGGDRAANRGRSLADWSGSLQGIGLPEILGFLASAPASFRVGVEHGAWRGEVYLDHGTIVAAEFAGERGFAALNALALVPPEGQFVVRTMAPPGERSLALHGAALQAFLERLAAASARLADTIPSLAAVPQLVRTPGKGDGNGNGHIVLDRSSLATLLAIDGQRTVADLMAMCGRPSVAMDLATLVDFGLVRLDLSA